MHQIVLLFNCSQYLEKPPAFLGVSIAYSAAPHREYLEKDASLLWEAKLKFENCGRNMDIIGFVDLFTFSLEKKAELIPVHHLGKIIASSCWDRFLSPDYSLFLSLAHTHSCLRLHFFIQNPKYTSFSCSVIHENENRSIQFHFMNWLHII